MTIRDEIAAFSVGKMILWTIGWAVAGIAAPVVAVFMPMPNTSDAAQFIRLALSLVCTVLGLIVFPVVSWRWWLHGQRYR